MDPMSLWATARHGGITMDETGHLLFVTDTVPYQCVWDSESTDLSILACNLKNTAIKVSSLEFDDCLYPGQSLYVAGFGQHLASGNDTTASVILSTVALTHAS